MVKKLLLSALITFGGMATACAEEASVIAEKDTVWTLTLKGITLAQRDVHRIDIAYDSTRPDGSPVRLSGSIVIPKEVYDGEQPCDGTVRSIFFNAIEQTGLATVGDAWVEKANGGECDGDYLDKIIYINPVGGKKVTPQSCVLDTEGYTYDDKPLGDHYPLIGTFAYSDGSTTGIGSAETDTNAPAEYYDLGGRRQPTARKGLNIVRKGEKVDS